MKIFYKVGFKIHTDDFFDETYRYPPQWGEFDSKKEALEYAKSRMSCENFQVKKITLEILSEETV